MFLSSESDFYNYFPSHLLTFTYRRTIVFLEQEIAFTCLKLSDTTIYYNIQPFLNELQVFAKEKGRCSVTIEVDIHDFFLSPKRYF